MNRSWAKVVSGKKGKMKTLQQAVPTPPSLQHPSLSVTKNPPVDFRKVPAQRTATTHKVTSNDAQRRRINDRERRTQILRKLPPATKTDDIIDALASALTHVQQDPQFTDLLLHEAVSSVIRDANDRRRWYLTFSSHELKVKFSAGGYFINETHVPAEVGDIHAMIPDPPFYLDDADLLELLSPFGTIIHHHFNNTNGVRTGSFHFDLNLHPSSHLPEYLSVDGHLFQVIDKGALKQCTHCDAFGHIRRECRQLASQRMMSLEERAMIELQEQQEEEHERTRRENQTRQFDDLLGDPHANTQQRTQDTPPPESQPANGTHQDSLQPSLHSSSPPPIIRQTSPSGTSSQETPLPTPSKRDKPENGHACGTSPKRHIINSHINALFKEFAPDQMETEDETISDEEYQHYVGQRRGFATVARNEVVAEHYPGRNFDSLSKGEWQMINEMINARFRELLISAFPDKHCRLNLLYLSKKHENPKPP